MREQFIVKRFSSESNLMIEKINQILDAYESEGYDLSLRQLYYQLVSKNLVENTERSYKSVGDLVSDARLAGLIDWNIIRDRGRQLISSPHWNSPAEILRDAASQFRVDLWLDQPFYVEVMVEKQALEGVLVPVCRELDVSFMSNKGYSSSSAMYEASKRYLSQARRGKSLCVLYLGDHDPSGIDMTRDVADRLELFVNKNTKNFVEVKRVALNMDQVEELNPPKNPAKLTDSRASDYISKFGTSSWELDAIEPKQLASLVRSTIWKLVDSERWEKRVALQSKMQRDLVKMSENYKTPKIKK